jgi:hypothetical protein
VFCAGIRFRCTSVPRSATIVQAVASRGVPSWFHRWRSIDGTSLAGS